MIIGKESGGVLEIITTDPQGKTNLGAKVGDRADQVLALYSKDYIEPVSIHGGKLIGFSKSRGERPYFSTLIFSKIKPVIVSEMTRK